MGWIELKFYLRIANKELKEVEISMEKTADVGSFVMKTTTGKNWTPANMQNHSQEINLLIDSRAVSPTDGDSPFFQRNTINSASLSAKWNTTGRVSRRELCIPRTTMLSVPLGSNLFRFGHYFSRPWHSMLSNFQDKSTSHFNYTHKQNERAQSKLDDVEIPNTLNEHSQWNNEISQLFLATMCQTKKPIEMCELCWNTFSCSKFDVFLMLQALPL